MSVPLTQTNAHNQLLTRPAGVESEIEATLLLTPEELHHLAAQHQSDKKPYISSECLVYLIRQAFRSGNHQLFEVLAPLLFARAAANLNRSVHGFREPTLSTVKEEILGKLTLLLVEPSGRADFFEVRFNLGLARLRIDVCHQFKHHEDRLVYQEPPLEEQSPEEESGPLELCQKHPLDQEQQLLLKQMLAKLSPQERHIFVLHRFCGIPINAGTDNLVLRTQLSERTIRNRLRSAESTLFAFKERAK